MRRNLLATFVVVLLCSTYTAWAHHAASTKYDEKKPVTLKGSVTKVEWLNPHVYFYIDVKDSNGNVVNWAVENAPPNVLYRRGWGKDALKIGDMVTVEGFPQVFGKAVDNGPTVGLNRLPVKRKNQ